MRISVLVTTMHQTDKSIYKRMNIQTDAVIANQADAFSLTNCSINGNDVIMITTPYRGTSRNRNTALEMVQNDVDVIIFADDDLIFPDNYESIVENEFSQYPDADVIRFKLNSISKSHPYSMPHNKTLHKAGRRDLGGGVPGVAIKTKALKLANIRFNERFGPGTDNFCGEDVIFLQELFSKGLKIYFTPTVIADLNQQDSSWFEGYTDKYFQVGGKVFREVFPVLARFMVFRSAYRFSKRKIGKSFRSILKNYQQGISEYRN